jgi:hypothetical protein
MPRRTCSWAWDKAWDQAQAQAQAKAQAQARGSGEWEVGEVMGPRKSRVRGVLTETGGEESVL